MATPKQDLKDKLKLENTLRNKLVKFNNFLLRDFRMLYGATGIELNTNAFNDDLSIILNDHWSKTTNVFSDRIGPRLPADVEKTKREQTIIDDALLLWGIGLIKDHAQEINVTTQRDIAKAVITAQESEEIQALTGREAQLTTAAVAATLLRRRLAGRIDAIIATETNIPAEAAKATEVEVLMGRVPSIQAPSQQPLQLKKTWVTVGDSLVRPAHIAADGQTVLANEAFTVGGQMLRYPGDSSLGASAGNTINCRCGARYNRQEIIDSRRKK